MSETRIQKTGEVAVLAASDGRLTLSVPIRIKQRSGRAQVTLPSGGTAKPRPWDDAPTALQLALARGHRWLAMLESGQATVASRDRGQGRHRQQLRQPDGQPDDAGAGRRCGHPGRHVAGAGDAVRPGGGSGGVVGGAAGAFGRGSVSLR